jgi:tubulin polyglutamylase TTLL6/13
MALTINILFTQYDIIHWVASDCSLRTSTDEEEDWDIWFIDGPILPILIQKMKAYQRTNHFPSMYSMARKNLLAKNLLNMQKYFE